MLTVTFADLRYRYRQFLIAVVGAGVVLAMGILLAGLAEGFKAEINRTVGGVSADSWVMTAKSQGRLTSVTTFPAKMVTTISHERGVKSAAGLVYLPEEVAQIGAKTVSLNIMGARPGTLPAPVPTSGRAFVGSGQAVVDPAATGGKVGGVIRVGSISLKVVGLIKDRTLGGGMPIIYMSLHDAQVIGMGGLPLVTAVVTKGVPTTVPRGLQVNSPARVDKATLQVLGSAISSIKNTRVLMWVVAVIIVAALIYVSALQRVRDFAVLKALGSSSRTLFMSLCLRSVIVTLVAAGVGAVSCSFLRGVFNQPVVIPTNAFVTLPIVAILVGLFSSLVALRAATKADPVAAFGG